MRTLILLLCLAFLGPAQDFRGTVNVTGRLNASNSVSSSPAKVVSSLPVSCAQGETVYLTTAPLSEWVHVCTSTNIWTKQALTTAVLTTGSYSDPAWISALGGAKLTGSIGLGTNVTQRIRNMTILPFGYTEYDVLNFRFDDSATAFAGEYGTITLTGNGSPSAQELKNLFTYNPSYINLNNYKDGNSTVVIELSGINLVGNSSTTRWNPYVFCHSACEAVTGMKLEIKDGADHWRVVYDSVGTGYVTGSGWYYADGAPGGLKGARWTFTGITGAAYLKMLGVRGLTEPQYKWTLLRSGGDLYGDVRILDGTTPKISLTKSTGTVTATTFAGALTGNASTATALASNGTNCPAGQSPLGVDASGNAEGCWTPAGGGGSGTVTSVGLSMPSQFAVSGSPVTASGTLTAGWNTQSANTVFAGPGSGGAAVPAFRSLVGADLPASAVQTTGSYSDPAWLTLTKSKVGLGNVENTALSTWTGSSNVNTIGTLISGAVPWLNVSGKPTFASANTASAVVQRDASGNFSAGTITANLTGNASTASTLQTARSIFGVNFDGSANIGSRSGSTTEFATVTGAKTTGKQLAFDATGNVIASATDIGAGGGGGITVDDVPCLPGDTRWVCFEEEFALNSASTGQIGALGWWSAGTIGGIQADWPHVGIVRASTSSSTNNVAYLRHGLNLDNYHDYSDDYEMEAKFIFRIPSTTDYQVAVGIMEYSASSGSISRGAGLYAAPGGNFQLAYTTTWLTQTYYDLGVAVDTGWHTFRIRTDGTTARKFYFKLDNQTEVTLCESGCTMNTDYTGMWFTPGAASTGVHGWFAIRTTAAASKQLEADYFSFKTKLSTTEIR
jgi:hypothetical protein